MSTSARKPPEQTRFKPGQSGNPRGRPKGSKNLATLLAIELAKPLMVTENGRSVKRTRREVMLQRLILDSVKGQHRATEIVLRLEREFAAAGAGSETEVAGTPEAGVLPDKAVLRRIQRRLLQHIGELGEEA